jgi:opacity protein-like surface antigen
MGYSRVMRLIVATVAFAVIAATPAAASDPLSSLRFMVGTWNCTYNAGKTHVTYRATFAYDLGNNWMRESDSWTGGGGDLGMFTYEPQRHNWTAVVMENERTTTIFRAKGSNASYILYRSVYPDSSMTDLFERTSPTRYTLHFTQNAGGKTMKSNDVCVKT